MAKVAAEISIKDMGACKEALSLLEIFFKDERIPEDIRVEYCTKLKEGTTKA